MNTYTFVSISLLSLFITFVPMYGMEPETPKDKQRKLFTQRTNIMKSELLKEQSKKISDTLRYILNKLINMQQTLDQDKFYIIQDIIYIGTNIDLAKAIKSTNENNETLINQLKNNQYLKDSYADLQKYASSSSSSAETNDKRKKNFKESWNKIFNPLPQEIKIEPIKKYPPTNRPLIVPEIKVDLGSRQQASSARESASKNSNNIGNQPKQSPTFIELAKQKTYSFFTNAYSSFRSLFKPTSGIDEDNE